jgi:hypothetical protein
LDETKGAGEAGARGGGQASIVRLGAHKARSMPTEEFRREVEEELTGREEEPAELSYFRVSKSRITVIEKAIETAA